MGKSTSWAVKKAGISCLFLAESTSKWAVSGGRSQSTRCATANQPRAGHRDRLWVSFLTESIGRNLNLVITSIP
eukprot:c16498_g1_i1 orf=93-314(+)